MDKIVCVIETSSAKEFLFQSNEDYQIEHVYIEPDSICGQDKSYSLDS